VFVHPAIIDNKNDTEGLGVVLTEANACGKPVIASMVGGIIDVIKHEQNGLLIEEQNEKQLAAAILKLKNDPELLKQLGCQARQYALSNFTWKKNVEKTVDLLNKL
jgi:phosphatidylinositol alpha-1,6-mannosyltransferase